jgi:hypothetical protein
MCKKVNKVQSDVISTLPTLRNVYLRKPVMLKQIKDFDNLQTS